MTVLTVLDHFVGTADLSKSSSESKEFLAGVLVMVSFQFIHMVIVVVTSVKLTKQVLSSQRTWQLGKLHPSPPLVHLFDRCCITRLRARFSCSPT